MALQAFGGLALAGLITWQLATGLRWLKLGRRHYAIHRWTGVTLAVLVVPHLLSGLYLAFGWFSPIFRALYGA